MTLQLDWLLAVVVVVVQFAWLLVVVVAQLT